MSLERWILDVMSGQSRGVGAAATRALLRAVEPVYSRAATRRNQKFDRGENVRRLPRPVISVGNLTTGGTGKTPAVQWLVRLLQSRGHKPGVLLRGYRREADDLASDEETLLRQSLGVPVVANPDRFAGGRQLLDQSPDTTVLVLDDGFQHRRLARDLDIVLIDATNPFGFDHVLPRGLLREPPEGLARAGLVILTRVNQVEPTTVDTIERRIRTYNAAAPIVRSLHAPTCFLRDDQHLPLSQLKEEPVFALSGIGNPEAFERSLVEAGVRVVGARRFADHHQFVRSDVEAAMDEAQAAGAVFIATTEKDWTKLDRIVQQISATSIGFLRLAIELRLLDSNESDAVKLVDATIERSIHAAASSPPAK